MKYLTKFIFILAAFSISLNVRADFISTAQELTTILSDGRVVYFLKDGGDLKNVESFQNQFGGTGYQLVTTKGCKVEASIIEIGSKKKDVYVLFKGCP